MLDLRLNTPELCTKTLTGQGGFTDKIYSGILNEIRTTMEGRREKIEPVMEGKVAKMRIPDADMQGWIESLREGNLDDREIDEILSHLNPTYKEQNFSPRMKESLKEFVTLIEESAGRKLTPEERTKIVEKLKSSWHQSTQEH